MTKRTVIPIEFEYEEVEGKCLFKIDSDDIRTQVRVFLGVLELSDEERAELSKLLAIKPSTDLH